MDCHVVKQTAVASPLLSNTHWFEYKSEFYNINGLTLTDWGLLAFCAKAWKS